MTVHPAASHNLPPFITAPGQTDTLMIVIGVIVVLSALGFGTLLLRLHHLPEHIAHKSQKVQYEIVAVLGLIAMFTHMNIFWIAALILAVIDLPDFGTPLRRIADSAETIAGTKPGGKDRRDQSEQAPGTPIDSKLSSTRQVRTKAERAEAVTHFRR
jgi:hypothetical protein